MPLFAYEARAVDTGIKQIGTVEAGSHEAAIETLQRHNLIITKLEDLTARTLLEREIPFPFLNRISKKDTVMFSRQLAVLFGAHVPLVESLRTLAEQSVNPKMRRMIQEIGSDVDGGLTFSQALAKYPVVFSLLYVSVVHSGEVSGKLQEVLEYLAKNMEREYHLTGKIRGALMYPALVTTVFFVVLAVMAVFIIPKLTEVLEESGQDLPLLTRVIIGMTDYFRRFVWVIILGAGGLLFGFFRYISTKEGKELYDRLLLRFPMIGELAKNLYCSRMSDNLGTLIASGLPITQAIEVTADVVGNSAFRMVLSEALAAVRRGEAIHGILRLHPDIVPLMVSQMTAVGERTGQLDAMLAHVARFYQQEVDSAVDNLVSLIEPLLIVVLGLGVAALVIAILLPIYNLSEAI